MTISTSLDLLAAVPLPAGLSMLAAGIGAIGLQRRRRIRACVISSDRGCGQIM